MVDFFLLLELPFFFRALILLTSEFLTPGLFFLAMPFFATFLLTAFAIFLEDENNKQTFPHLFNI